MEMRLCRADRKRPQIKREQPMQAKEIIVKLDPADFVDRLIAHNGRHPSDPKHETTEMTRTQSEDFVEDNWERFKKMMKESAIIAGDELFSQWKLDWIMSRDGERTERELDQVELEAQ